MISNEEKYQFLIKKDGTNPHDLERKALFYILAGNYDLYEKKYYIYDFDEHTIIIDCLNSDGIDLSTSSRKLIELGFNHFNGYPSDVNQIFQALDFENAILAIKSIELRYRIIK